MQKYQNSVANSAGRPVNNAVVTVTTYPGGTIATIYSDNGVTPQNNPTSTDSNGNFAFYAANGRYSIQISGTGITTTTKNDIVLFDPADSAAVAASKVSFTPTGGLASTNVQAAVPEVMTDLAASSGSSLVGTIQSGTGAVARTVQDRLRDVVSVKDFGAKGDGVTDDTAARNAAFDFVKGSGFALEIPPGVYRVTSGYTQSTNYGDIFLKGPGRTSELVSQAAAVFLLDSTDPASFFLTVSARCTFSADGLTFKCNQFVQDRPFIKFAGPNQPHFLSRCDFESVERPIVYGSATYFQNASLRDVQFRNSGTIHSEAASGTLVGTGLILDNVNHEGSVPANTEKVVCNLTGVRNILASETVMEGTLAAAGWTVLKLDNSYDAPYTRAKFADFFGFHSEWSGNQPAKVVDQKSGTARFRQLVGLGLTSVYALSSQGRAIIEDTSFSATLDEPSQFFTTDTAQCVVEFVNCGARTLSTNIPGFIHRGTQWLNATNGTQVVASNAAAQKLWSFDGGQVDGGDVTVATFGGCVAANNTDATYGRKLSITPSAGSMDVHINVKAKGRIQAGDMVGFTFTAKLPNFTTGLWGVGVGFDNVVGVFKYYDTSKAGQIVSDVIYLAATAAPATNIGASFSNGTSTGATSDLEIYECTLYQGHDVPRVNVPVFSKAVTMRGTAAPTTGSWAVGDYVKNAAPAVGSPKGWLCTVAGAPGTWVSEGSL